MFKVTCICGEVLSDPNAMKVFQQYREHMQREDHKALLAQWVESEKVKAIQRV